MRLGTTTLSVTQPGRRRRISAVAGGGGGGSGGGGGGGSSSGIVTTNLALHVDAGDTNSYSGTGTTWSDLTSNSNDLTLTNGPTFSSANSGVIDFDGTNDYALTSNTVSLSGDFTFDLWVKFDNSSHYESILSLGNYKLTSGFLAARAGTALQIYANNAVLHNANTLTAGSWIHFAFVRSGNTVTVYLDGTSVGTHTNSNALSGQFYLGTHIYNNSPSLYLDGKISNARVYNGTALSAAEVLQNYNALSGRF